MNLQISGHHIEVTPALREYVENKLDPVVRHFDKVTGVSVVLSVEKLKQKIAERLESELADRMVNHMATELATDIKQILSVKERREMLRGLARDHMDAVMAAGSNAGGEATGAALCDRSPRP